MKNGHNGFPYKMDFINMKKLFYILLLLVFLSSCASHPGRVCGGRGGGRVVENAQKQKTIHYKPIT